MRSQKTLDLELSSAPFSPFQIARHSFQPKPSPEGPLDDLGNLRRLPSTVPPTESRLHLCLLSPPFLIFHVQHKRFPVTTPHHCWIPDFMLDFPQRQNKSTKKAPSK